MKDLINLCRKLNIKQLKVFCWSTEIVAQYVSVETNHVGAQSGDTYSSFFFLN